MKGLLDFNKGRKPASCVAMGRSLLMVLGLIMFAITTSAQDQDNKTDKNQRDNDRSELIRAEQPPPPCTPNETAARDVATVDRRGDIVNLPVPLETRLLQLAARPHSYLPIQARAEATTPSGQPKPSQLFQYYLIDTTGFQPNIFTSKIPGINDNAMQTAANQANCGQPTIGSVRLVVEPKPGLPTDPNNPRAFIDIFTDVSGLFVINNESGWYEGWMIHDLKVLRAAAPRPNGRAQYGTITHEDAAAILARGAHNNVPGNFFTVDGNAPHLPRASDHFPDEQTNLVSFPVSLGTFNAQQQSDVHA